MSRTYKDQPNRIRFPEVYPYWVECEKTKKRREVDTEWHWMSTPGWWTRLTMNRPQRRAGKLWEQVAKLTQQQELETLDYPGVSHKPHIYYW